MWWCCSEKLKDRCAIQGTINVSWIMQKFASSSWGRQTKRSQNFLILLGGPIYLHQEFRVLETHAYVQQLCVHSDLPMNKLENAIQNELQEIMKAQDALNKALESRRQDMDHVKRKMADSDMHMAKSPLKLSEVEFKDLLHSIKMESQIVDCDPLSVIWKWGLSLVWTISILHSTVIYVPFPKHTHWWKIYYT